jgi:hypothetical protein
VSVGPAIVLRLRRAVEQRGWTDAELCQRAGISKSSVLRLWREEVGWETVHRVALAVRLELDLVDCDGRRVPHGPSCDCCDCLGSLPMATDGGSTR